MTSSNPSESRIDRLEALAETTLLAIQQQSQQINELRKSLSQQNTDLQARITQQGEQMQQGISDVVSMITQQAEEQGARHAESERRFENLLQDARADRQQAERDRALNESEHRAFRETFQTLLAEVARIWQRLAG